MVAWLLKKQPYNQATIILDFGKEFPNMKLAPPLFSSFFFLFLFTFCRPITTYRVSVFFFLAALFFSVVPPVPMRGSSLSLICLQKRGGIRVKSCCSCCASLSKTGLVHALLLSPATAFLASFSRLSTRTISAYCVLSVPPKSILPLGALLKAESADVPMPITARVFGYGAVSAHARTQMHQPVSPIHDTSYAFIRQKRSGVIAGSCCNCCDW